MKSLKPFEQKVIRVLTDKVLPQEVLDKVLEETTKFEYEYTGSGYFLTFSHSDLPSKKTTCNNPILIGQAEGIRSGFIVYLENGKLALECHSWGELEIPSNYRDLDVTLSAT